MFSKDPKLELYSTTFLPSVDAASGRIATMRFDGHTADLVVIDENKPAHAILHRDDLILAPQWSADGKQIVAGVGAFHRLSGFHRRQQEAVRSGQWRRPGRHAERRRQRLSRADIGPPTTMPFRLSRRTARASSIAPSGPKATGFGS